MFALVENLTSVPFDLLTPFIAAGAASVLVLFILGFSSMLSAFLISDAQLWKRGRDAIERTKENYKAGKEGRKVRLKTKGKQMGDVQVNRSPGLKLLYRGPSFLPAVINLATAATQTLPFRSFTIGAGHL
jgi:hypothetical protein